MATIQVREGPDETYEVLVRRAKAAGQSLQQYMRQELMALARRQSKAEAVAAIAGIRGRIARPIPSDEIVTAVRQERPERETAIIEAAGDRGGRTRP